jgi:hypothetical protein
MSGLRNALFRLICAVDIYRNEVFRARTWEQQEHSFRTMAISAARLDRALSLVDPLLIHDPYIPTHKIVDRAKECHDVDVLGSLCRCYLSQIVCLYLVGNSVDILLKTILLSEGNNA